MDDKKPNMETIINSDGIVIRWPKKKEEKLAVLDYLITKFEPGVEYKEIQVNKKNPKILFKFSQNESLLHYIYR